MRPIVKDLDSMQRVKCSADAVHICILVSDAAFVSRFGNPFSRRFIAAIKSYFIKQFLTGSKELCLYAFLEECLMLLGAVSQKKAATGWYFECPRRVLIGTDFPQ
jgi:hypothetical protein